ncbi:MAG TPA: hypothetical protein VGC29_08320 [Flavisolibacter sp.]
MKKFLLLLLTVSTLGAHAQNVVGYWYGTANVSTSGPANNYLVELILKQNQSSVQAVMNYYFKNTYRSIKLNGNYNTVTRELSLFNIAVPYFGNTGGMEVDCAMDFKAIHRVSRAGSNLVGRFIGKDAYKYTCPDIVFDLKLNQEAGNLDSVLLALKNFKETFQVWTPSATDTLVAAVVQQRKIENIVVNKEFRERELVVQNEIEVLSDSVQVDFYDNGEIDGDSISVFFNGQLMAANLKLSTRSIQLNLKLDSAREYNEISMFANNLGSIPPNTALMMVYDVKKRYEIRLSSSLEKNAAIRIRKKL